MDETISAIETIMLRIPLDIWGSGADVARGAAHACGKPLCARDDQRRGGGLGRVLRHGPSHGYRGIRQLDQASRRWTERLGRPLAHALAGLDIALWDIRGKLAGVPVSTLLGGAKRTRVECYASLLQYSGNSEYIKPTPLALSTAAMV